MKPFCRLWVVVACGASVAIWVTAERTTLWAAQAPQASRDTRLATTTADFLTAWLVKRDPKLASVQFVSPLLADERFIPPAVSSNDTDAQRYSAEWMLAAHPMLPAMVQNRIAEYLTLVQEDMPKRPTLKELLMPFTLDDAKRLDENLGTILLAHKARSLPNLDALSYPVHGWRDIQWTASGTVGYRTVLPGLIETQRLSVEAVVSRIRTESLDDDPTLLVTIWAERAAAQGQWKLLGVEVPPTK